MLTKGAIGNLINRYKAVLKKCNLINTFGSLAVASMLVLGGAGVAGATAVSGELASSVSGVTSATNVIFAKGDAPTNAEITGDDNQTAIIVPFIRVDKDITLNGGLATGESSSASLESLNISDDGTIVIKGAKFTGGAMANTAGYCVDAGAIAHFQKSGVHTPKSFDISDSYFNSFSVTDSGKAGAYGGAVAISSGIDVALTNITMKNNTAIASENSTSVQGGAYHQAGGTYTMLCNHHLHLVPKHFNYYKGSPIPTKKLLSISSSPLVPG